MATFTLERSTHADLETVFAVMTDHRGYAGVTPVRRSDLEREGTPAPDGLGAVRSLYVIGPPLREEITGWEPPSRFEYTLRSGLPVRDHVGTIQLSHSGGGTHVAWSVRTTPTVPLVGPVLVLVVKQAVARLLDGLIREAERRAA